MPDETENNKFELHFSRHILLDQLDVKGVKKIQSSRVLVIGAGGLGCPAVQYLASSGIGTLQWVDPDVVDESNLLRQILFAPDDVGKKKILAAKSHLERVSPKLTLILEPVEAHSKNLPDWIKAADIVLECTDRFKTKQLVNQLCVKIQRPLVIGSAIQWVGQLLVVEPRLIQEACYACIFDPEENIIDAACGAYGVFSPAVGTIGVLQANEALKIMAGIHANVGKLLLFDALKLDFNMISIKKRKNCPVCNQKIKF